tara:strand:+ start:792 stop:1187 length:396 start_codon:yes stop_codon:yes gene_type:complete
MYHDKLISNGTIVECQISEISLRTFFAENEDALGHAAVLLGGRRGARLMNAIRNAFAEQASITRSLRQNLMDLRSLLLLEHAYDENWSDDACFALLEPDDPIVPEICLLADTFNEALLNAGLIEVDEDLLV